MTNQRRDFLKQTGLAATAFALAPSITFSQFSNPVLSRDQILERITKVNDRIIQDALSKQIDKPGDRWHGGFMNEFEMAHAHFLRSNFTRISNSFISPFSEYYLSDQLHESLNRALSCLLNVQHDDGTIDLYSTNFQSPPDTAFFVNFLSPAYAVLLTMAGVDDLSEKLGTFIKRAGESFLVGGIHTANHRWVMTNALVRVNQFFPSKQYIDRMDEWLSEGIDIDPDGQYQETSVATYTPHVNNAFQTIGHLLDRPELLDVVRRNLNMTLYYIRPKGELMATASNRGNRDQSFVTQYYYGYKYFSIIDQNPVFAALCDFMERELVEPLAQVGDTGNIPYLLEDPVFKQNPPSPTDFPKNFVKRFPHSGVYRIRRENRDLALIEENPTFMTYMKGEAVLQSVRLHAAFYGRRGQFQAEEFEVDGNTIHLKRSLTHGYWQPFPEDIRTGDGDWSKMPRHQREMTQQQTLNYRVSVTETNGKVSMDIEIEGTDYVPVSVELSFRPGGDLTGVEPDFHNKDCYFMKNGMAQYKVGNDVIHFGPGRTEHKWSQMRGMLPKHEGYCVYLTGETPFKHTIELG